VRRGARLITVHPQEHNLSFTAEEWLQPETGATGDVVESLARAVDASREGEGVATNGFSRAAKLLREAVSPLILVGSGAVHDRGSARILDVLEKLARAVGARVLVLPAQNNLYGSILMGAYPELLPGGVAASDEDRRVTIERIWDGQLPDPSRTWTAESLKPGSPIRGKPGVPDGEPGGKVLDVHESGPGRVSLDVLYLVGEVPMDERPPARFVIYQNITPPGETGYADLVLPAAGFAEVDGTFLSGDGRVRHVRKAVDPPADARPDWEILSLVARKMGVRGFDFQNTRDVHEEIARLVLGFGDFDALEKEPLPFVCEAEMVADHETAVVMKALQRSVGTKAPDPAYPFLLTVSMEEHTYRGFPISTWVGGAREIFRNGWLEISPGDAEKACITEGDDVIVWSAGFERVWRAQIVDERAQGSLRVTLREQESLDRNTLRVNMRKRDV
jgi:predicted molibdopterin-dependent oxidoreductase YjgC